MNERALLDQIQTDLQKAPFVLYLEGKTDPDILFGLLGIARPASSIYQNVFVAGLEKGGSGGRAVRNLVQVAVNNSFGGVFGKGGIFGVCDADGRPFNDLSAEFDAPFAGPLFTWKAYCIENLLAKTIWPASWGVTPDWPTELEAYAPYVALNRLHVELRSALETLRLAKYSNPAYAQPLLLANDVEAALQKDKDVIAGRDIARRFSDELNALRQVLRDPLDQAHALINGKWLVSHFARTKTGRSESDCLAEWIDEVRSAGGFAEVRDLWQRVTGAPP